MTVYYRYSDWDGTQHLFDVHEDDLMDQLSEELLGHGDVWRALQRLFQRGMDDRSGQHVDGVQDLMQRLRRQRQNLLDRYDLSSIIEDLQKRLNEVIDTERGGMDRRLQEARGERSPEGETGEPGEGDPDGENAEGQEASEQGMQSPTGQQGQRGQQSRRGQQGQQGQQGRPQSGQQPPDQPNPMLQMLENIVNKKQQFLDELPEDLPGQIKELSDYEFMDDEARQKFQELMDMLKQRMMQSMFRDMNQSLQNLTPEQMQQLREMIQDLNQMMRDKLQGKEPDFQSFMQQHGDMFGENPPQNFDEFMEQMRQQMAQMQSLLSSMSPEMRQQLMDTLNQVIPNDGMRDELAQLAAYMEYMYPTQDLERRYPFSGDQELSLEQAMRLMDQMQDMEGLEQQLRSAQRAGDLDNVDADRLAELLGEEARQSLEQLKELAKLLEEAGYVRRNGNKLELTARGQRKIGQKALRDIFSHLRKDRMGDHDLERRGIRGERADETKKYEFGDPFLLHLEETLMNAVRREGPGKPVQMHGDDFQVFNTEHHTQSSTVLMLDLSRSMGLTGAFIAAKKVALALNSLIKGQFPRDHLYVVGFSDYAVELKGNRLHDVNWSSLVQGTNMHHGFMLARQLLSKHKGGTKQIVMITDGEPTCHLENGRSYFSYPPSYDTIRETLREVGRCTREGVVINTFMLDRSYYLIEFINQLTKINKGRAFFTAPEKLGEYILFDYIRNKRRKVA
jgi:uncharacterized protein with von Willebrand factor type A (vWA) domain